MLAEEEIRALLDGVRVPPTGLRVAGLVSEGRQRVRQRRRVATAAAFAVVVLGVVAVVLGTVGLGAGDGSIPLRPDLTPLPSTSHSTPSPPASPRPSLSLGTPCLRKPVTEPNGATDTEVNSVSADGRYLGGYATVGGEERAVLWTDGKPALVGTGQEMIYAVNSAGVALIHSSEFAPDQYHPIRYANGVAQKLPVPGTGTWTFSTFAFLNEAGDIAVGVVNDGFLRILLWPAGSTVPQVVSLPKAESLAGLGDDGTLITRGQRGGPTHWDRALHSGPFVVPPGLTAYFGGVRGKWMVGTLVTSDHSSPVPGASQSGTSQAALWDVTSGALALVTQLLVGDDVSRTGIVLGGGNGVRPPLVSTPAGVRPLNANTGVQQGASGGISDGGLVVGSYDRHPVTWQC